MGAARIEAISLRYYGALADNRAVGVLAASAAAGVLRPILAGGVSIVNARAAATERGIEIIESRSTRPRHFTSLVSIKLHTSQGDRWAEGTVFEPNSPRLVSVRGVNVEAPLAGTLLIVCNQDQPGVIGEVGSILGSHGVNIANFALGRNETGAVGVVNVDEEASEPGALEAALGAIRRVSAVGEAWLVRVVASVPSQWFATQFPGGASRLAALLLAHIRPVCSLVAPCDPGAAPGTYATIHWDGTLGPTLDLSRSRRVKRGAAKWSKVGDLTGHL